MSSKIKFLCKNCDKEIFVFPSLIKKSKTKRFFCCRKCKHIWTKSKTLEEIIGEKEAEQRKKKFSKIFLGEDNPNFGKRWNKKQREKASKMMIERMKDSKWRFIAGSANRGVKWK